MEQEKEWYQKPPYEHDDECRSHDIQAIVAEAERLGFKRGVKECVDIVAATIEHNDTFGLNNPSEEIDLDTVESNLLALLSKPEST